MPVVSDPPRVPVPTLWLTGDMPPDTCNRVDFHVLLRDGYGMLFGFFTNPGPSDLPFKGLGWIPLATLNNLFPPECGLGP